MAVSFFDEWSNSILEESSLLLLNLGSPKLLSPFDTSESRATTKLLTPFVDTRRPIIIALNTSSHTLYVIRQQIEEWKKCPTPSVHEYSCFECQTDTVCKKCPRENV